jgi:hypothetical protein
MGRPCFTEAAISGAVPGRKEADRRQKYTDQHHQQINFHFAYSRPCRSAGAAMAKMQPEAKGVPRSSNDTGVIKNG